MGLEGELKWHLVDTNLGTVNQLSARGYVGREAIWRELCNADISDDIKLSSQTSLHNTWNDLEDFLASGGYISGAGVIRKKGKLTLPLKWAVKLNDDLIVAITPLNRKVRRDLTKLLPKDVYSENAILVSPRTIESLHIIDNSSMRGQFLVGMGTNGNYRDQIPLLIKAFVKMYRKDLDPQSAHLLGSSVITQAFMDLALTKGLGYNPRSSVIKRLESNPPLYLNESHILTLQRIRDQLT